jgi:hypothetical protein
MTNQKLYSLARLNPQNTLCLENIQRMVERVMLADVSDDAPTWAGIEHDARNMRDNTHIPQAYPLATLAPRHYQGLVVTPRSIS